MVDMVICLDPDPGLCRGGRGRERAAGRQASARPRRGGLASAAISLLLFFLFGSFFGGMPWRGPWWAVVLIAIGVLVIVQPVIRRRKGG